jgi:MFS family permease
MSAAVGAVRRIQANPVWRAFGHRNYRLWFVGQSVSGIGTWMQMVAQSWLVLALTGDPFMMGVVAAAQYSPVLLFGLFGGIVADGLPKRRVLLATQTTFSVLALVLWALTASNVVQVWHVALVAFGFGLTNAIDMPVRNSFSVEMVGREDVSNAVALNSALFNAARIIGPAIAGLTIGVFGVSIAFLINGLSYVGVIVALLLMHTSQLQSPPLIARPGSVRAVLGSLGEGLGYVRRTPIVLLAVVLVGVVSTFGMNFTVLMPALARDVLGTDASGYGFLMAASGLGALTAAIWIAAGKRSRPMLIGVGGLVFGLVEVALGFSRIYPLSLLAMLIVGAGSVAMTATANATVQLHVPDQLRGRVMSVYMTIFVGSTPIGSLIVGAIASSFGTDVAVSFGGAVSAAAALYATVRLRRILAADREGRAARRLAEKLLEPTSVEPTPVRLPS